LAPKLALDLLVTLVQVLPEMKSASFEVLDELVRNPHVCVRFRDHPILRIHAEESLNIPLICRTPLAELQLRFSQDPMYRWKNWKLLESAGLSSESRLLHISTVLLSAVSEKWYWTPDFFDAAVDLFDFLRYVVRALSFNYVSSIPAIRQSPSCARALRITLSRVLLQRAIPGSLLASSSTSFRTSPWSVTAPCKSHPLSLSYSF
jgi:hypothetical protein